MVNIITSKTRRARRWYKGSNTSTVQRAIADAVREGGATRQTLEREVLRHAAGSVNAKTYGEVMEAGMRAIAEHHMKQAPGVTVTHRPDQPLTPDKGATGKPAEEATDG